MRILYLPHYYPPEVNAPAQRVETLCRAWAAAGDEVHVVTGCPSHPAGRPFPGYELRWHRREVIDGVHVHRVGTLLAANRGVVRRGLNYASFMLSGAWRGWRLGRFDVVVATSPQILCAVAGWIVGTLRRCPWVFEVRDLWPESIGAVGAVRSGFVLRAIERVVRRMYRSASAVVCVTRAFVETLAGAGVPREKLHYVPNGVTPQQAPSGEREAVRGRLGLAEGEVLALYAGTLGMAHGLGTVLDAARRLDGQGVRFVLAGDGAERERLEAQAEDLANVTFTGLVPRDEVRGLLAACDLALVPLRRDPVFRTVLPSKMLEAMAWGKPVVLGVEGEAARILEEAGGGICVPPEDSGALAGAVERLAADPEARARFGASGRNHVVREFSREVWAQRYRHLLTAPVGRATGGQP